MDKRTVLYAEEGTYLTNGEVYGKKIELADWDSADNYRTISQSEYNAIFGIEEVIE